MMKTKRILALALCIVLLAGVLPLTAAASSGMLHSSGNFYYSISGGEVTITKGAYDYSCPREGWPINLVIPDYIDGYPVTKIASSAFYSWQALDTVVLPETLEEIGSRAFLYCQMLRSVDIPHVKTIGEYAFRGCISLEVIQIPSSAEQVGDFAYFECEGVTEIYIGEVTGKKPDHTVSLDVASVFCDMGSPKIVKLGNIVKEFDMGYIYRNELQELWVANSVELEATIGLPGSVTVYGYTKSSAESCALDNGTTFVPLDDDGTLEMEPMTLVSVTPTRGGESSASGDLELTFNLKPAWNVYGGSIYIKDYYTDETALELDWEYINSHSVYNENTVRIMGALRNLPSGKYYVLIDKALFTAEKVVNGVLQAFPGITQKEYWTFIVPHLELESAKFRYFSQLTQKTEEYVFDYTDTWFFEDNTLYNHELAQMAIRIAMAAADTKADNIKYMFDALKLSYNNSSVHYPTPTQDSIGYAIGSRTTTYTDETINLVVVAVRGGGYGAEWGGNLKLGTGEEHSGFQMAANTVVDGVLDYIGNMKDPSNLRILITGYSRAAATSNLAAHKLNKLARAGSVAGLDMDSIYAYCFECPRGVNSNSGEFYRLDENIFNIVNPVDVVPLVAPPQWNYDRYGTTLFIPSNSSHHKTYIDTVWRMEREYRNIMDSVGVSGNVKDYTSYAANYEVFLWGLTGGLTDYFGNVNVFFAKYQPYLVEILAQANDVTWDLFSVLWETTHVLPDFLEKNPKLLAGLLEYGDNIGKLHYPELCLAWMDALEGSQLSTTANVYNIKINCPVNVTVYDEYDNIQAQIVDNQVISSNDVGAYIDDDGQKVLAVPAGVKYFIEIEAEDEANVSFQIEEFDMAEGDSLRVVNYYDVPMEKGSTLTMKGYKEEDFVLVNENNRIINPTSDTKGEEIKKHTLTVAAEGDGSVEGGGSYIEGEFAIITATPNEKAAFAGWYNGDVLISQEAEYRFRVEASMDLIAKFEKKAPMLNPFVDVKESDYYYDCVLWAVEKGVTSGTSPTTFSPGKSCTRAQIVTFLWRAMGEPEPALDVNPFADVKEGDYYYKAVLWAVEKGITSGISPSLFAPDNPCTRDQVVTFLWRTMDKPQAVNRNNPFADVKEGAYYYDSVLWAVENGITSGMSPTSFAPGSPCTRGQVVTFLYRILTEN